MIFYKNKKADDTYVLSYLCDSNEDYYTEIYDSLITDGDVVELVSDCRSTNYNIAGYDGSDSIEIVKVVSVSNASYTIIQKIKDSNIKYSVIQTMLRKRDIIDILDEIALTNYDDSDTIDLVKKVRLR